MLENGDRAQLPSHGDLHSFLLDHYSDEELRTLCFKLYIPYDDLPGGTREGKARELVAYAERHGRLEALLALLASNHPADYKMRFDRKPPAMRPPATSKTQPGQVFISHAHQDSDLAHELAGWLVAVGYPVWLAPDSIRPGEQWVDAIERGLATSETFLLLISPAAVASSWVRFETSIAISQERRDRLVIVPLLIAECDPPLTWQAYQAIPYADDPDAAWAEVVGRLGETATPGAPPPKRTRPPAGAPLSDWQADQIQVLAWSVGLELGRQDGRNLYQPVYALLNSHFEVSSYRDIPAARYPEARRFLANWLSKLVAQTDGAV
jgi:hypothetical protein